MRLETRSLYKCPFLLLSCLSDSVEQFYALYTLTVISTFLEYIPLSSDLSPEDGANAPHLQTANKNLRKRRRNVCLRRI